MIINPYVFAAPPGPGTTTTWDPARTGSSSSLSSGDLVATLTDGNSSHATNSRSSGKWYWEVLVGTLNNASRGAVGVGIASQNLDDGNLARLYRSDGTIPGVGSFSGYATGDVIGVALDLTGNTCAFYKNNTLIDASSIAADTYFPGVQDTWGIGPFVYTLCPDAESQTYSPPGGFSPFD